MESLLLASALILFLRIEYAHRVSICGVVDEQLADRRRGAISRDGLRGSVSSTACVLGDCGITGQATRIAPTTGEDSAGDPSGADREPLQQIPPGDSGNGDPIEQGSGARR